ncbi:MAG: UDP-N-acetylmuramoyl-tripeptide--D-alanyl-D-alanine ligase [Lewinellaceae bacterium]|nr:UDP-N-acetylmuramoyl-tripeptide--D-alanyl-D-alanine ligase [Saprospiraceae bacterium]MCB9338032.1 UDP-N-acetylmuramoyl-tripeptide--D-alanyl-D-alanine ligase [Lewinellaceae bacterium]
MISIEDLYSIFRQHPKIVTDSREVRPGCLFFALKGERFNGNEFARQALENGAAYCIVDEKNGPDHERLLKVDDVLTTLQGLAAYHRQQFNIPVIAITGSNGKTTTKELVSAILSSQYPTHWTKGNFNNHIGVPLTLLAMPLATEVAIIEMGANHQGEIDFLCRIAAPTHGLITNIGKAHLEGFGGLEGVKKGKSELYRYLAAGKGVIFINSDELYLEELVGSHSQVIYYHKSDAPSLEHIPMEVKLIAEQPFLEVAFLDRQGEMVHAKSQLIGTYNFNNIMTAVALGKYFKVPADKIKQAIESYVPANNRSQVVKIGSNTFVLDAYNANPTSMKNALKAFSQTPAGTRVAILGAMLELGEYTESEHEYIANYAQSLGFGKVVLVGNEFKEIAERKGILYFQNTNSLKTWFDQQGFEKTHFLVKGSRSIGLERFLLAENAH